jgi:hypothetical protein
MDISTDKYEPNDSRRPAPFLAVSRTVRGVVSWLAGLFKVSQEDLSDAGIYLGGEGRD